MKKKFFGLCVCMLMIATALPAVGTEIQAENNSISQVLEKGVEWNITYNGGEFDECRYIIQTMPDKGYLVCGVTEEANNYYVLLLKLDADGNEEWHVVNYDLNGTSLTSTQMDVNAMHIIQTEDDGYLVTGVSVISDYVEEELVWVAAGYLWKIDAVGTTEWVRHYYNVDELRLDFTYGSLEIDDGYMSTGFAIYYDISGVILEEDGFLMQTDSDGNQQWIEFYPFEGNDVLTSICGTSDGGYLCTGFIDTATVVDGALRMLKTDDMGGVEWQSIFDGPGFEYTYGKGCFETSDGGYIMAGNTASYGAGIVDAWVIKTDASGNEVWNKTFGFTNKDYTWCMDKTAYGTYAILLVKDYTYFGGTYDDIYIVEFNESGETEWCYLHEEAGIQRVTGIYHTEDHGFIVSGRTNEYGISTADGIVYKFGAFPMLDIEISGGIGVTATVTNNGAGDALGVPWEITVTGGILGMINITKNGTIDVLAGETQSVSTGLFFGLGNIDITTKIGMKETTSAAKILLLFVI